MGMGIETFQTYCFHCAAARFSIFTYAAQALGLSKALISKTVAVRIDYIITERGCRLYELSLSFRRRECVFRSILKSAPPNVTKCIKKFTFFVPLQPLKNSHFL